MGQSIFKIKVKKEIYNLIYRLTYVISLKLCSTFSFIISSFQLYILLAISGHIFYNSLCSINSNWNSDVYEVQLVEKDELRSIKG